MVRSTFLLVAMPLVEDGKGVAAELLAGRRDGDLVVLAFEELLAELCFEALDGSAQRGGADVAGAGGPPEVQGAGELYELVERVVLDHGSGADVAYCATSRCRNVAVRIMIGSVDRGA